MSEIEFPGGRGKRSTDPSSPTGFEATDRALGKFLERRKRMLEKAKAERLLCRLLRLEQEEAARREQERRARITSQDAMRCKYEELR